MRAELVEHARRAGERVDALQRELAVAAAERSRSVRAIVDEGASLAEVAAELGVSRSMVQKLASRGREA